MRARVCVGALAGILSGLFGVGGGILIVPGLVLIAGMAQRRAHGTSLAAIVPVAGAGLVGYLISGEVDAAAGACLAIGAVGGAVIGTNALRRASHGVLQLAFAGLLVATGARMVVDVGDPAGRTALTAATIVSFVAIGLASGLLAGLFGVGGGIVMVPAMVLLFSMPDATAKGTSLLVIIPTSLIGTWRNVRNDNADLRIALLVGSSGAATALLGARLSLELSNDVSSWLFAALLIAVAVHLVVTNYRERRRASLTALDHARVHPPKRSRHG